jgi:hypothetical protein
MMAILAGRKQREAEKPGQCILSQRSCTQFAFGFAVGDIRKMAENANISVIIPDFILVFQNQGCRTLGHVMTGVGDAANIGVRSGTRTISIRGLCQHGTCGHCYQELATTDGIAN